MIFCGFLAARVDADTIFLKNGRYITASEVTDSGDSITYETAAGQLSLPKSLVLKIQHDGFSDTSSGPAKLSSSTPISTPTVDVLSGYSDVARLAVRDNVIDFSYIARLESEARGGGAIANERAAAANFVAAQFLLNKKHDPEGAIDHCREALTFTPDNPSLLLNLAILYLRDSQFTKALDPLEHARAVVPPDSPIAADVAKLMGWAYHDSNKLDRAIEEWKRSEEIRKDPEVESALEKTERDRKEEEDYREGETAHFAVKYYGGANPQLATEILRALEDDFRDLESQLDYTPPEQIAVILYTNQAFADITRAPGWVGALNDGRLRIPVQGLTSVTPQLAHVLKHELTHSFVGQKTHGRAPTWVQEGVAQWMEGKRTNGAVAAGLVQAAAQGGLPDLHSLEAPWMNMPDNMVAYAYPWSLAVMESVLHSGDMSDVQRFLGAIGNSPSAEAASREVLRYDYAGLQQQTIEYLHHEFQ